MCNYKGRFSTLSCLAVTFILSLLLALFLGGCGSKSSTTTSNVTTNQSAEIERFYPLDEGLSWTYYATQHSSSWGGSDMSGEITVKNLAKRELHGETVVPQRRKEVISQFGLEQTYVAFKFVARKTDGIYEIAYQGQDDTKPKFHSTPVALIKFPLDIGRKWASKQIFKIAGDLEESKEVLITFTNKIESKDAIVTVPAGTFEQCLKIKSSGFKEMEVGWTGTVKAKVNITRNYWYAPEIGLVKFIVKQESKGIHFQDVQQTWQLQEFNESIKR